MLRRASLKDNISQTTKETKAKFNDLIFRENFSTENKPSNYSIPFSSWLDTKCSFTESMNTFFLIQRMNTPFQELNKEKTVNFSKFFLSLAPSKKYTMIEKFKNELNGFKNILNEIRNQKMKQKES